jgi:hypothetical protein
MGRRNRMTIMKRQRERKKAEKAAMKREQRSQREKPDGESDAVATAEDLEGYGIAPESDEATD